MEIRFLTALPGPEGRYPVNLFFQPERENARAALIGTPGLVVFCDLNKYAEVRGLDVMESFLYAVCGDTVYRIDSGGSSTSLGTIGTSSGHVWMADNGTQLMIVDGDSGYIVTGSTLTEITDSDFPTPASLTYQDGYFIVSRKDTGEFYISALLDGTSWDATDYATAEGAPDDLVAILSDHRELWLFGEDSTEIWYNSGASFPFDRIEGAFIEKGCIAPASPAKLDNSVYWLDDQGQVERAAGYTPKVISTPEINHQIETYSTISDAIGFGCVQGGHAFYLLTFPSADKTWVFDATTGLWHERQSFKENSVEHGRHRANCYAYFNRKHLVGDYQNGKIYELSSETYKDDGQVMKAIRTAPPVHMDRKNIFFHSFEIEFKAGVGLITNDADIGTGQDPQAILQWSDDEGRTWSNEHWASMGKIGETTRRAIWRRLGVSRNRTFRLTITDPVERVITGAYLEAEVGMS